jgi:hypothetical protein
VSQLTQERIVILHMRAKFDMVASFQASLLIGLAAVTGVAAQIPGNSSNPQYFEQLERYWTYGRSPPVYPSRKLYR